MMTSHSSHLRQRYLLSLNVAHSGAGLNDRRFTGHSCGWVVTATVHLLRGCPGCLGDIGGSSLESLDFVLEGVGDRIPTVGNVKRWCAFAGIAGRLLTGILGKTLGRVGLITERSTRRHGYESPHYPLLRL